MSYTEVVPCRELNPDRKKACSHRADENSTSDMPLIRVNFDPALVCLLREVCNNTHEISLAGADLLNP